MSYVGAACRDQKTQAAPPFWLKSEPVISGSLSTSAPDVLARNVVRPHNRHSLELGRLLCAPELPLLWRCKGRRAAALRVSRPVENSWTRIEAWLAEHHPELLDDLKPGASDFEIAAIERHIGQQLPEDVRVSCRIYDGQHGDATGLLYGLSALLADRSRVGLGQLDGARTRRIV